jgi:magnesium transporter
MIRTFYRKSSGGTTTDLPQHLWPLALKDQGGLLWIDFSREPAPKTEQTLLSTFNFHKLTVFDAVHERNLPKIDNWGSHVYISVHEINCPKDSLDLTTHEVDIFLGGTFLITHHGHESSAVGRLWDRVQAGNEAHTTQGPDHLLFALLDLVTTDHTLTVDTLDDAIDRIEDDVFQRNDQKLLGQIFAVKHAVMHLRQVITLQREVMNRLAREEYPFIDPRDRIYFRDLYDQMLRISNMVDNLRDMAAGAMDIYLSVSSNRLNEVMKILTVTSVLFLPLTFLTGFFGMNFEGLPFDSQAMLLLALVAMIGAPVGMLAWFRHRGWL